MPEKLGEEKPPAKPREPPNPLLCWGTLWPQFFAGDMQTAGAGGVGRAGPTAVAPPSKPVL